MQRDKATRLADCFIQVADQLEERRLLRLVDAVEQVTACETEIGFTSDPVLKQVRQVYVTDGTSRGSLSIEAAIEWYRAVAVGLKGGE